MNVNKEYKELIEEKEGKSPIKKDAPFSIHVNKYPENEPKTNDSYFKYQGDIPISTKNPSFTYQESESPRKSFASASGDFSKMIPPNTFTKELKEKAAKIQIASLMKSKIHKFSKKKHTYSDTFFAKYALNKLAISDIVSINIDDYKTYIEESIQKDGKIENPLKKIQNFLDWYLQKNISDILSNQMFHEYYYILERLQFSPDMTKLAYATFDHSIRIDTINSEGKLEQNDLVFKYHTQKIIKIDFSNDGTKLVTLCLEKFLIFWDINDQIFLFKLQPENENFRSLRFSHNDKYFAAGTDDSLLTVWTLIDNCRKNFLKHLLQDHKKAITALDFSNDDVYLCSGSEDKMIMMHHVESGDLVHCFKDHYDTVTSLRFSHKNNTFMSGGRDKKLIMWDADKKCKIRDLKNSPEEILHIRYSPDGSQIFSVDKDGKIYVFDSEGNVKLGPLKEHEKSIETIGFMNGPDDRHTLVTASRDRFIVKWNTLTGKIIKKPLSKYPMNPHNSHSIISPDSQKIITMTNPSPHYNNTLITKWKAGSGTPDDKMEYQNIIFIMMTFSTNSECFAGATNDRRIFLWKIFNITSPFHVIDPANEFDITSLAYYVDRKTEFLAAGSSDKRLNLWDAAKNKQICDGKDGHEGPISLINFSPDGSRMATYSFDYLNTIAIWNPTQRQRLFGLMDHGKIEITSIKFSQDSTKMACGNKLGTVYIYNAAITNSSKWKLFPLVLGVSNGPITSISFSKYNLKIAIACNTGKNNEINVWDYTTGSLQIGPLIGHHYEVKTMCFSREDSVLTSFSKDSLKSWRFFNKISEKTYPINGKDIYDVSFDGSKILGKGTEKNEILIYNSTDFSAEFNKLETSSRDLKFLNFSSDAMYCLGGDTITLTIWVVRTGEVKQKIKDMFKSFVCGIFSKKAEMIATGSFSGSITLWSLNKGVEIFTFHEKHKGEVILLDFSPDDNYCASADIKNKIFVWNIEKKTKIYEMMEHEAKLISLDFSFDSSSICSISEDHNIKLWSFLNSGDKMRDLEKSITKNKKMSMLKFTFDWNMYCIILENRKKIEFYDIREKFPIKSLEFENPILKVFWSKNNDIFLVFHQELKCYMNFLNRDIMFLEKGLKICEFYRHPEKFSPPEIQKIVDGNDGKVVPFSYTFLQIVAYTNDFKSFFRKLLTLLKNQKIKISSHAFFDKDIHGNSSIDIILKKREKNIIKMFLKYIIKNFTVRELYKENYSLDMTLFYSLLQIFGHDTYIIDRLLKMSFDYPERFPENFNSEELPEPLYIVRPQPHLTKTEIKPILTEHIEKYKEQGYTPSKFKTKIQVKCVYIADILNENNPDTMLFLKNICKLSANNKLFENDVLGKVISYKWESQGYGDFLGDGKLNFLFLLIYLFNALLIFPHRSNPDSDDFELNCIISLVCDIVIFSFLIYQAQQEISQCITLSIKHYISSFWNVIDVMKISSGLISTSMDVLAIFFISLFTYAKGFHSFMIFGCFLKLISFARGVKSSAFIVRLVFQVFSDIRSFLFIVFIFVFDLGFSVFMIQTDYTYNPLESFNIFFRNILGDFTDFDNLAVIDSTMLYVFFMIGSLLVTIILLNLLIAIICDTYKKVSKNEKYTRIYELCSILYETDTRELVKSEDDDASEYLFYISNESSNEDKDKQKLFQKINRKLKENNYVFTNKMVALEQRLIFGENKDKTSS